MSGFVPSNARVPLSAQKRRPTDTFRVWADTSVGIRIVDLPTCRPVLHLAQQVTLAHPPFIYLFHQFGNSCVGSFLGPLGLMPSYFVFVSCLNPFCPLFRSSPQVSLRQYNFAVLSSPLSLSVPFLPKRMSSEILGQNGNPPPTFSFLLPYTSFFPSLHTHASSLDSNFTVIYGNPSSKPFSQRQIPPLSILPPMLRSSSAACLISLPLD